MLTVYIPAFTAYNIYHTSKYMYLHTSCLWREMCVYTCISTCILFVEEELCILHVYVIF